MPVRQRQKVETMPRLAPARAGNNAVSAPGTAPLRVGIIGSGFMAGFHLQAMHAVRDAVIGGVYSPNREHRDGYARVAVLEALMALYRSAETGTTVTLPDQSLESYVPPVARPGRNP